MQNELMGDGSRSRVGWAVGKGSGRWEMTKAVRDNSFKKFARGGKRNETTVAGECLCFFSQQMELGLRAWDWGE